MTIVTKEQRDDYLRTKNRFYQTGWLDAERNEDPQITAAEANNTEDLMQQQWKREYICGYEESMSNAFTIEGGRC